LLGIVCPPGILNRNWSITNHILQVFSLRLDPQSPLAARWNRRLSNLTGQLSGKAHDSQVLLRQIHCELLRRSDLIIAGYLIWGNGQAKVFGEETVSLFAVLELVIMSARIAVLVPSQIVLFAKQTEEWPNPTIDIRLHQSGTKAAVILCVMNEQGRTRCADGHKEGIILILSEVRCVFFDFVRVKRRMRLDSSAPMPATSTATATRVSRAPSNVVCQPP